MQGKPVSLVFVGVRDPMHRKIVSDAMRAQYPDCEIVDCERLRSAHVYMLANFYSRPLFVADERVLARFPDRSKFSRVIVCVANNRRYAEFVNVGLVACRFSSFAADLAKLIERTIPPQASF